MHTTSTEKGTEATRALRSGWKRSRLLKKIRCQYYFCAVILLVVVAQLLFLTRILQLQPSRVAWPDSFLLESSVSKSSFQAETRISEEDAMNIFNSQLEQIEEEPLRTTKPALLKGESPFVNLTTELFTVWPDEKMPSKRCFPASSLPHPLVYQLQHVAHNFSNNSKYAYRSGKESPTVCSGQQFTEIYASPDSDRVMFSMQQCPAAKWSSKRDSVGSDANAKVWQNGTKVGVPRSNSPGVDWLFTSCKGNAANATRHTNLRIKSYRVESLPTTPSTPENCSVVVIVLDSISHALFSRDLKETKQVLEDYAEFTYVFKHTSTFGQNSKPNLKVMMANPNLFQVARSRQCITSVFEDYCPDHSLCPLYPYKEHRLCANLMCNYKSDITELYSSNPKPGCIHGEFFLNQHLRFMTDLWEVYRKERKFHVSKPYGCHMEEENRYLCNGNDAPLAAFLRAFVPSHPETVVILASDHGFHWGAGKGTFNDHIAGEYEHRNPFLGMIIPWAKNDPVIRGNTENFVTHRDLHATILGLLAPTSTPTQNVLPGVDLIRDSVPEERSCRDAHVPDAWCNCFRPRQNSTDNAVDTKKGTTAASQSTQRAIHPRREVMKKGREVTQRRVKHRRVPPR